MLPADIVRYPSEYPVSLLIIQVFFMLEIVHGTEDDVIMYRAGIHMCG